MLELVRTLLYSPIYWLLMIILFGILIVIYLKEIKIIGWFGEHWVKKELKRLPKDQYIVLNNIFVTTDKFSSQIDHVVISQHGIFVIETKQYHGHFIGTKYDKYWTRLGKKNMKYLNPIRLNYGHIQNLAKVLEMDEDRFINLVCFPGGGNYKRIKHDGELTGYYNIVDKILSYKAIIIDNPEVVKQKLLLKNIKDKKGKRKIIKRIKIKAKI